MDRAQKPLSRDFYARDPRLVAVDLLNKVLVTDGRRGRIVETEAYLAREDPAAHSYRGPTARNATMWGPPGHLYVYFSYGMHWCANASCGEGRAVLLRALAPLEGIEVMHLARAKARPARDLTNGPARLTQAMGIVGSDDGADLVTGDQGIAIVDDGTPPPDAPVVTTRIGITKAAGEPWRFYVPGEPNVSRPLLPKPRE